MEETLIFIIQVFFFTFLDELQSVIYNKNK